MLLNLSKLIMTSLSKLIMINLSKLIMTSLSKLIMINHSILMMTSVCCTVGCCDFVWLVIKSEWVSLTTWWIDIDFAVEMECERVVVLVLNPSPRHYYLVKVSEWWLGKQRGFGFINWKNKHWTIQHWWLHSLESVGSVQTRNYVVIGNNSLVSVSEQSWRSQSQCLFHALHLESHGRLDWSEHC